MSTNAYARIYEKENGILVEIPVESDGSLLLSNLTSQFPDSTGLLYKEEGSGVSRGLRVTGDRLFPPPNGGWLGYTFNCVFPKESRAQSADVDRSGLREPRIGDTAGTDIRNCSGSTAPTQNQGSNCSPPAASTDLIVLGLSWRTRSHDMKQYFSKFGEVLMAKVKLDPFSKASRGYGFIHFADYESQTRCLESSIHLIDDRPCQVKLPTSRVDIDHSVVWSRRLFVHGLPEGTTQKELGDHFAKYAKVADAHIPFPFRGFGFVTLAAADQVTELLRKRHQIRGAKLEVMMALPQRRDKQQRAPGQCYQQCRCHASCAAVAAADSEQQSAGFGMASNSQWGPYFGQQYGGGGIPEGFHTNNVASQNNTVTWFPPDPVYYHTA